jgi:hypothetical protein
LLPQQLREKLSARERPDDGDKSSEKQIGTGRCQYHHRSTKNHHTKNNILVLADDDNNENKFPSSLNEMNLSTQVLGLKRTEIGKEVRKKS